MDDFEPEPKTLAYNNKNKNKNKKRVIIRGNESQNDVKEGDLIWAEAFPKTWWPGRISSVEKRGSCVSVSFFDSSSKNTWFWVSEVKPFEEFYLQCRQKTGFKVANAANLAFEEMNRTTVLSLNCCVTNGNGNGNGNERDEGEIGCIRDRFEPIEVLKFVRDLGKYAFVAEDQIVRTVRVCSEIYAFNRYRSLPNKVSNDYSSGEILEFIRAKAVNVCYNEDEFSANFGVISWIMEYRDFTSVCPRWIYPSQNEEIEDELQLSDSSEDEHSEDGIPDSLHSSDLKNNANGSLEEENLKLNLMHHMDLDASQIPVQEGPEICTLNRIDFGFFDSDEESREKGNSVNLPSDKPDIPEEHMDDTIANDDNIVNEESCEKGISVNLPSHKPDKHEENMDDVIKSDNPVVNSAVRNIGKKRKKFENEPLNNSVKLHKSLVKNLEEFTNSNGKPNYPYHDQNALHIPDPNNQKNKLSLDNEGSKPKPKPKLLCIKFPMDYEIPSEKELENLFGIFGLLDGSKTRVFPWLAEVVFLKHKDAIIAFEQLKRKNIFGDVDVKVRFWFDEYESFRVGSKSARVVSSLHNNIRKRENLYLENNKIRCEVIKNCIKSYSKGLKSCLKNPNSRDKKKVRFTI